MTAASTTAAKPITRALIAALKATAQGTDQSNLRRIVDSLVDKAIGGDLAAMREIFDRIDGKASAGGAGAGAEEPPTFRFEWKRDE